MSVSTKTFPCGKLQNASLSGSIRSFRNTIPLFTRILLITEVAPLTGVVLHTYFGSHLRWPSTSLSRWA
jgi:hypothetical protein